MSAEIFGQTMPLGKHWRLALRTGMLARWVGEGGIPWGCACKLRTAWGAGVAPGRRLPEPALSRPLPLQNCPPPPASMPLPLPRRSWARSCRGSSYCPEMRRGQHWARSPLPSWKPGWSTFLPRKSNSGEECQPAHLLGKAYVCVRAALPNRNFFQFSLQGALQLKQDFNLVRELLHAEDYGLSPEIRQLVLSLRIFQQVDNAITCLLQQPSKASLPLHTWDAFHKCCECSDLSSATVLPSWWLGGGEGDAQLAWEGSRGTSRSREIQKGLSMLRLQAYS